MRTVINLLDLPEPYINYEIRMRLKQAGCPILFNVFDLYCVTPIKIKDGYELRSERRDSEMVFTWTKIKK